MKVFVRAAAFGAIGGVGLIPANAVYAHAPISPLSPDSALRLPDNALAGSRLLTFETERTERGYGAVDDDGYGGVGGAGDMGDVGGVGDVIDEIAGPGGVDVPVVLPDVALPDLTVPDVGVLPGTLPDVGGVAPLPGIAQSPVGGVTPAPAGAAGVPGAVGAPGAAADVSAVAAGLPASVASVSGAGDTLASTGSASTPLATLGILLIVGGAGAVAFAWKRPVRRSRPQPVGPVADSLDIEPVTWIPLLERPAVRKPRPSPVPGGRRVN